MCFGIGVGGGCDGCGVVGCCGDIGLGDVDIG